jgi:8-amino-7-oxononanoate synthase
MNGFEQELEHRLAEIRAQGLYRELRTLPGAQGPHIILENRPLLNFSSNDYLGLANDPALKEASLRAIERYGAGAGASRLVCGTLKPHAELESALALFKNTEAALAFSTGYAAAVGTINALMDSSSIVIVDKLVHACVIDAVRMCGAKLRVYKHNDMEDLERILQWAGRSNKTRGKNAFVLVVTESVFSMDGDHAPLRDIVALKEKHGAWLMVDEAHATGLYGPGRCGLAAEQGVANQIEIQMGTLSKAIGGSGGFICGSHALIALLINRARSFVFSTAPPPAVAATATAGIHLIRSTEGERRCAHLWELAKTAGEELAKAGFTVPPLSAILPLHIGDETAAMRWAAILRERGFFIPAMRYPTVARGQARLRLTLSAAHSKTDIMALCGALQSLAKTPPA